MRIIAGRAKGIRLLSPSGWEIRPTLDRVRESVFNILTPRLENAHFLDLFAGTGANGIEAISRGAVSAVFVDDDRRALDIVRDNLARTRLAEHGICIRGCLPSDLETVRGSFDIIFADPPYAFAEYAALLEGIREHQLLVPDGALVLEHDRHNQPPETIERWHRFRQQRYGDTIVSFYT